MMHMTQEYNSSSSIVKNPGSLIASNLGYIFTRMRFGQRLKRARSFAKLTQSELSERISLLGDLTCSQVNISKLERSETATGSEFTVQFAICCGISATWLATGRGHMIDDSAVAVADDTPAYAEPRPIEHNAPPSYRQLAEPDRQAIDYLAERLAALSGSVSSRQPNQRVIDAARKRKKAP